MESKFGTTCRMDTTDGYKHNIMEIKGKLNAVLETKKLVEKQLEQSDDVIETIPVPVYLVGQIIGGNGANLKEIKAKSGAQCWVDDKVVWFGGKCRMLEIRGNLQAVFRAKHIIDTQLGKAKL